MRAVCQRVSKGRVTVAGAVVGEIHAGMAVLLGVAQSDTEADAVRLAGRVARLRIFEDERSRFDRSLLEVAGEALVVSQFTLIAETRKGNRPSFTDAAAPAQAERVYDLFTETLQGEGVHVERGLFGARMQLELVNDGPVTIILDS